MSPTEEVLARRNAEWYRVRVNLFHGFWMAERDMLYERLFKALGTTEEATQRLTIEKAADGVAAEGVTDMMFHWLNVSRDGELVSRSDSRQILVNITRNPAASPARNPESTAIDRMLTDCISLLGAINPWSQRGALARAVGPIMAQTAFLESQAPFDFFDDDAWRAKLLSQMMTPGDWDDYKLLTFAAWLGVDLTAVWRAGRSELPVALDHLGQEVERAERLANPVLQLKVQTGREHFADRKEAIREYLEGR